MNTNPKVLIVDDRNENLIVLEKILSDLNIQLIKALSGNEALAKTLDHDFALAILDVQMPHMDGYETAKYMRKSKKTNLLPIIFVSAVYSENDFIREGLEVGAVDFIIKPIIPEIIRNKVKVFLDIHTHQNEIIQSKSYIQSIIDNSLNAIIVTNSKALIQTINPTLCKLLKCDEKQILNQPICELFQLNINEYENNDVKNLMDFFLNPSLIKIKKIKKVENIKLFFIDKNGISIPISLSATPLYSNHNKIYRVLIEAKDIREVLKIEKIEKEKQIAIEANKAKTQFLANMSHEIRTPMNVILGFTELLLMNETDKEKSEMLNLIDKSSKHLLELINDILDLSKIESGKIDISKDPFILGELINNLFGMFKLIADKKKLNFEINSTSNLPETYIGDRMHIKQVLVNILGNAFKFTENGKVSLTTKFENNFLVFIISDTGIGIHKDKIKKIFDAFTQIKSLKKKVIKGTGLGLSISKNLVFLMGGDIDVQSKKDIGTTFTITIPVELSETKKFEGKSDIKLLINQLTHNLKILVAEDDPSNQELIKKHLTLFGYQCDYVKDGTQVLEYLNKKNYDLLLLDIRMPNLDGFSVLKQISKEKKLVNLNTIAITASIFETSDKLKQLGCLEVIYKPINKDHLLSSILKLEKNRHSI